MGAPEYETVLVPLRYERPIGADLDEWRENVRKTALYRSGDTVLIWVNEADLAPEGPFVKQYMRRLPETPA